MKLLTNIFSKFLLIAFTMLCRLIHADIVELSDFFATHPVGSMHFVMHASEQSSGEIFWDRENDFFVIKQLQPMQIDYQVISDRLIQIDYELEERVEYDLQNYLSEYKFANLLINPSSLDAVLLAKDDDKDGNCIVTYDVHDSYVILKISPYNVLLSINLF